MQKLLKLSIVLHVDILLYVFMLIIYPYPCLAEVNTDGSLGAEVTLEGPNFAITDDLGQIRGSNLYHSFSEFSIQDGESATFSGPASIENIISRVTGGNASYINGGLISTIDGANLFLLNPYGVMFGPWANLDIKGSFHASTADYLRFDDDTVFYADPTSESALSVAGPEAFGFLTDNPASITVDESWLSVPSSETFSLTGGDINITGTTRTVSIGAPQGRIQIVGVGKAGEVNLDSPEVLNAPGSESGNIHISNATLADPYEGAKTVIIKGGRIELSAVSVAVDGTKTEEAPNFAVDIESESLTELSEKSAILCFSGGPDKGRNLQIKTDEFIMNDESWIDVIAAQEGAGGDITIDTQTMTLEAGSNIQISSYATGAAGTIQVNAAEGISLSELSSIKSVAQDQGAGGDIKIDTAALILENEASIYTSSLNGGACGSIQINAAEGLSLKDTSSIEIIDTGDSGNIVLNTQALSLESNSQIRIISYEGGAAGSIHINTTDEIELKDASDIGAYGFDSSDSGDIIIGSKILILESESSITNISWGSGSCGAIQIETTDSVMIHGGGPPMPTTGIRSGTDGTIAAGEISISTPYLELSNEGAIVSTSSGDAISGAITLNADLIHMDGGDVSSSGKTGYSGDINIQAGTFEAFNKSGVTTITTESGNAGTINISAENFLLDNSYIDNFSRNAGNGGDINIEANQVTVRNNAMIEADSQGDGRGGNIYIKADNLELVGNGNGGGYFNTIATRSFKGGDAGNVTIDVTDTLKLLEGGTISTGAEGVGNAGDIEVNAGQINLFGGKIVATTEGAGEGGDINITTGEIQLLKDASIMAKSTGAGDAGDINLGVASNLTACNSQINTEASLADGGNINIETGTMARLMNSEVMASVGGGPQTTGGNVDLHSSIIILEESRLIANAFEGHGGKINIAAEVYIADPASLVDASSEFGIDGVVDIRAPFSNLSGSLKPLPNTFLSAANLLKEPCEERMREGNYGSFIVKGRDALPIEPGSLQISPPLDFNYY